jgi:hypothetical protein
VAESQGRGGRERHQADTAGAPAPAGPAPLQGVEQDEHLDGPRRGFRPRRGAQTPATPAEGTRRATSGALEACERTNVAPSSPEEIRKAFKRFGARFAVDAEGTLTLRLEMDLGEVAKSLQENPTFSHAATR